MKQAFIPRYLISYLSSPIRNPLLFKGFLLSKMSCTSLLRLAAWSEETGVLYGNSLPWEYFPYRFPPDLQIRQRASHNILIISHRPIVLKSLIADFLLFSHRFSYVVCFVGVRSLAHTNLRVREKNLFCVFYSNVCCVCGKGPAHPFVEHRTKIVWREPQSFRQRYNADLLHVMPFCISSAVSVRSA